MKKGLRDHGAKRRCTAMIRRQVIPKEHQGRLVLTGVDINHCS